MSGQTRNSGIFTMAVRFDEKKEFNRRLFFNISIFLVNTELKYIVRFSEGKVDQIQKRIFRDVARKLEGANRGKIAAWLVSGVGWLRSRKVKE